MFDGGDGSSTSRTEEALSSPNSQSLSANDRHRLSMENYQYDPNKSPSTNTLTERIRSPLADTVVQFDYEEDDTGKVKGSLASKYHILQLRLLRSFRSVFKGLGLAGVLILVLWLLLAPADPVSEWNQWPQEPKTEASMRVNRKLAYKHRFRAGSSMLGDHRITHGILKVNPDSTIHPIMLLLEAAQEQWQEKVVRQSRTLEEAVDEYKRRYRQEPPKGFDKWWTYVIENNVPLPDEYDQIYRDLAPFHSVSPARLNRRIQEASESLHTFTLKVVEGKVTAHYSYDTGKVESGEQRPNHQVALMQPIAHHLPDMSIVMSVSDTPLNMISWQHRSELMNRDKQEGYIDDEVDPDAVNGHAWACPVSSPLFNSERNRKGDRKDGLLDIEGKTFISDLREYMNICNHPELMEQHGILIGKNPPMDSLSPIISLSKTALHADILGIPTEQWVEGGTVPAWSDRKNDKVMWRGSNTGMHYDNTVSWKNSQRIRLVNMTNLGGGGEIVTMSCGAGRGTLSDLADITSWAQLNQESMDIKFTGKPLQCDKRDGTCEQIARDYAFTDLRINHEDALQYKYIIDVDGNAWSARFNRLLNSGALILKATIMPEWYSDRIQPWVHFVPLQMDFSDLYDVVQFFRPSSSNPHGDDEAAARIASAGRQWALTHWRKEDMTAYVFRLYLEWARLIAADRNSRNFVYSSDMEIPNR